jgi:hypothetical protein
MRMMLIASAAIFVCCPKLLRQQIDEAGTEMNDFCGCRLNERQKAERDRLDNVRPTNRAA